VFPIYGPTSRSGNESDAQTRCKASVNTFPAHHGRAERGRVRIPETRRSSRPWSGNRRRDRRPAGDAGDQPAAGAPSNSWRQPKRCCRGRTRPGQRDHAPGRGTRRPGGPSGNVFWGNGVSYTPVRCRPSGDVAMTKHVGLALLVSLFVGLAGTGPNGRQLIADPRALKADSPMRKSGSGVRKMTPGARSRWKRSTSVSSVTGNPIHAHAGPGVSKSSEPVTRFAQPDRHRG